MRSQRGSARMERRSPHACRCYAARSATCSSRASPAAAALLAVAVFIPGADLPVLVLNQIRMVLRLEQAYGLDADPRERAPELLATIAAGFGLRAVARQLLGVVPVAGWAVQGAVAYAGTRALGEAAVKRLEIGVPGGDRRRRRLRRRGPKLRAARPDRAQPLA